AMTRSSRWTWESRGRDEGQRESSRRAACAAYRRAHADGFARGHAEGWAGGWRDGWDEADEAHRSHAVVRVESVRIADASDDGVLEPGEDATLEASLANAGLVAAGDEVAQWSGAMGVLDRGLVTGGLDAQARRRVRV